MQTEFGIEKEKIKSQIKNFFEENKINYQEDKNHLRVKGEIFYADILQYTEISIRIGQDKYLIITYEETFPKEVIKNLEILKNKIKAVYYTNNKLVFLF